MIPFTQVPWNGHCGYAGDALLGQLNLTEQAQQVQQAQQQSFINQKHLVEYERQRWRASVSQNWLNAMLDVELGL